jgi:hypothetical protein
MKRSLRAFPSWRCCVASGPSKVTALADADGLLALEARAVGRRAAEEHEVGCLDLVHHPPRPALGRRGDEAVERDVDVPGAELLGELDHPRHRVHPRATRSSDARTSAGPNVVGRHWGIEQMVVSMRKFDCTVWRSAWNTSSG